MELESSNKVQESGDKGAEVQVTRRVLSNGLAAVLLSINGQEGMLVRDLTTVLGIPKQTVSDYLKTNGFSGIRFSGHQLQQLKDQNIIHLKTNIANWVIRPAVESLVRFISTPETNAIYAQLWQVARAVQSGDLMTAQATAGVSEDDALDHLEKALILARKFKKERDEAAAKYEEARRTKAEIGSRRESTAMNTAKTAVRRLAIVEQELASIKSNIGSSGDWLTIRRWEEQFPILATIPNPGPKLHYFAQRNGLPTGRDTHITTEFGTQLKAWHRDTITAFVDFVVR